MSRTILVAGAASGLGLEVSRELLARGWHVNVGSRDLERGRRAVEALRRQRPDASVDVTTDYSRQVWIQLAACGGRSIHRATGIRGTCH